MGQTKQDLDKLELSQGKNAIVDQGDYGWLSRWKWTFQYPKYAYRIDHKTMKKIYLHRVILNAPDGVDVDHINGDGLDNRRSNLRLCTRAENCRNSKKRTQKSKGVYFFKRDKVWVAQIVKDYKNYYLGRYKTEKDAAVAYDLAAQELHGNFKSINGRIQHGKTI